MQLWLSILFFLVGLGLVIFSAEYPIRGIVSTSYNFGLSAFIISLVFIGFDPENLGVGSLGAFNETLLVINYLGFALVI
jgi:cation:H+ antiporter